MNFSSSQSSQFIADIGGTIGLWVGASMMTIFEFGEFFLDAFVLFLAKCFRSHKRQPNEQRRENVRDIRQNNPDLPIRSIYDPDTNWNNASGLYKSGQGNSGLYSDNWIKADIQSRMLQNHHKSKYRFAVYE